MATFTVTQAKARLSQLIGMVEAGEEVIIIRRGQPVARLVRSAPPRQQLPSLAELRARLPNQAESASGFVRNLRDTDRY